MVAEKHTWPGWETTRLIGRGSFGAVYEIQRDVFGDVEKAALKVISIPQNASDIEEMYSDGYDDESITSTLQSHLKSIVAEYSLMKKMTGSANIVNCDDIRYVQHDDGFGWDIFIKMELLTPLTKALPEEISEEMVVQIAKDMCAALELCKKHGIVHRDIKPQNIFLSPNGDYKLGDFGIAKTVEKTMGGTKVGTYKYMAPEVYNNQPYGMGADIYSLGLVLYWLLNERRMPFLPLPPEKLSAGMEEKARTRRFAGETLPAPAHGSESLKKIVLKACAYNPKDRYQSAREIREDLMRLSGGYMEEKQPEQEQVAETTQDVVASDDATVGPAFKLQITPAMDEQDQTVGPVFKSPEPKPQTGKDSTTRSKHPKPKQQQKKWLPIAIGIVAIALIAGLPWSAGGAKSKGTQSNAEMSITESVTTVQMTEAIESPKETNVLMQDNAEMSITETETTAQMTEAIEIPKATNVLMQDSVEIGNDESGNYIMQPVFGSEIMRDQIKTITILDTLKEVPDTAWDVSDQGNGSVLAWVEPNGRYFDLYIASDGGVLAKDCNSLFALYENVERIDFNNCFDTSQVTDMSWMFNGCESLTTLDVSGFDTSKAELMNGMFLDCSSLTELDVSSFDTSNVTDMAVMFYGCIKLTALDVSGFDTSNVRKMYYMFNSCSSLTALDVSGFDTTQVTDMSSMFFDCSSLDALDVSGFDTSNVTYVSWMFYGCKTLTELDVSDFDTTKVETMDGMFCNCSALTELDVSNFDTSNVRSLGSMFAGCIKLTALDVSGFDTSNVRKMYYMFNSCSSLTALDVSGFDTSRVTDMKAMFYDCSSLTELDVSGFATAYVTDMSFMFSGCNRLAKLDVSGFATSYVTDMRFMFHGCNRLTKLDVSGFDTSKVADMQSMFSDCSNLTELDVSGFHTSNVTNMGAMFSGCSNLIELDVSNFDTSNVMFMYYMFSNCSNLTELDVSSFNTSNVTALYHMFSDCINLTVLDVSGFDTSNVTDLSYMFSDCIKLTKLDVSAFNVSKVEYFVGFMNNGRTINGRPWEEFFTNR